MTKIVHINESKAVALIKSMVKDWCSSTNSEGILDEACERAIREGIVTRAEIDAWDAADYAQRQRMQRAPWWHG